jgi:predicted regulator of Ras-like GTPase activity (Roadblock/LC7/MglB family)
MKAILQQLNQTISARGSLVVAKDGVLVAAEVRDGIDVDRLSALGAAIVTEVGASLRASGLDDFAHVEVAAEHGKVVLADAGPVYLMVLVGARLEIGPGSIEIQSAAKKLRSAADLATN